MTTHTGIHHVTAITGEPRPTLQFYRDTLGLRLVKRTVNFDDPGTWHLYFGDTTGSPGSIMTFFPWPGGQRGRIGTGQSAVTSFRVPAGSFGYWMERLGARGIAFDPPTSRFGDRVLTFRDPDGLVVELVASGTAPGAATGQVPAAYAIGGFFGTTLWLDGPAPGTEGVLRTLGLTLTCEDQGVRRWSGRASLGQHVDLRRADSFWRGLGGVGTVHHVAFRAPDGEAQQELRERLLRDGLQVTPVVDRQYFRSVYFREPGGVLFEVATDGPGFATDEPVETLGQALQLPPQYEGYRDGIAAALPPLEAEVATPTSPDTVEVAG
jgi:glyoxalase family protein